MNQKKAKDIKERKEQTSSYTTQRRDDIRNMRYSTIYKTIKQSVKFWFHGGFCTYRKTQKERKKEKIVDQSEGLGL